MGARKLPSQSFNKTFVAKKIVNAYHTDQPQIWLRNIDFDDWEKRIELSHMKNSFSPNISQVWLFHEMPIYNMKVHDNRFVDNFPGFLSGLSQLISNKDSAERN